MLVPGTAARAASHPETRAELPCREQLRVHRRSDVEHLRFGERPDHDRFAPGLSHEARGDIQCPRVVRGDWNAYALSRPVRLAAQVAVADGIEATREANAWQELRRGDPGALASRLDRHLAIALG